jgi:hypothetical protein
MLVGGLEVMAAIRTPRQRAEPVPLVEVSTILRSLVWEHTATMLILDREEQEGVGGPLELQAIVEMGIHAPHPGARAARRGNASP